METVLFLDHVGFTIIGEKVKVDDKVVEVKNPAIIQSSPNQQGQLQVQLVPVLFREFLDSSVREKGVTFSYPRERVVLSDADIDSRLKSQYEMMSSANPQQSQPTSDPEVIKLFDDEEEKK